MAKNTGFKWVDSFSGFRYDFYCFLIYQCRNCFRKCCRCVNPCNEVRHLQTINYKHSLKKEVDCGGKEK